MGNLTENYNILKELGRGGMGTVFLATDKRLDRQVAIKILQLNTNFTLEQKSEIISRFQKEAKAVARLSHPNIVGIYDVGEENSQYYMVMEFLEGKSIGSMIEESSLPIQDCVDISIQMCKALSYIHKNSIVHRDIKPDNILIIKDKLAKLTDFGIAQNESDALRLTQDGAILGSIMYISPEQLRSSKDVDNRADIYSYGVTLYQMLTGKLPFDGETVGQVVTKILSENPELPRKLNPSIPYELEAIVMKSMNKDRDKRYRDMDDMQRDLENLSATQSFKKTTMTNKPVNTEANNTSNFKNTTTYNNKTDNVPRATSITIEKADQITILIRTGLRLIFGILISYAAYNLIYGNIIIGIATNILSKISPNMIQGPYTQSMVSSTAGIESSAYSLIAVLLMLGFSAYTFPIQSKGIHRNFNIKAELLPALVVLIISGAISFLVFSKSDTFSEYQTAYNQDLNKQIDDFPSLLKKKGLVDYSQIDLYKKKYRLMLNKKDGIVSVYDDATTQIKENITQGDHIKLNIISANKLSLIGDSTMDNINGLITNVFSFNDPSKELYTDKINQIISTISDGTISSLPNEAVLKISKDNATNRTNGAVFNWEKNNLTLKSGSAELNYNGNNYIYPKKVDKIAKFNVENDTDKPIFFLLYSTKENRLETNIVIAPNKKEEIKTREGVETQALVLFKDKTAIPLSDNHFFSNNDLVKIDKSYNENSDYYTVTEKSYPSNQEEKLTKVDLKSQNIFFTNDADISTYNLSNPKKR
ncbi:MAG: serine/threonine protein kinase [Candidatus Sericytochromatia bacterium]|nr:serine/threonine protein kinase [Candidatus Sericytochromatia bacterium]